MQKFPSVFLIILLAASSLLLVNSVKAQMQKPDVPEFTVKYVDYSYYVAPQTTINQFTGQNIPTDYGYLVDNRTVVFTIKNQQFTPYTDSSGNLIKLYYNFQFKGPFGTDWANYPNTGSSYGFYNGVFPDTSSSKTQTTIILIRLADLASYPDGTSSIPPNSEIQFQVQAIEGYIKSEHTGMLAGNFMSFVGERSDWSTTQTVIVNEDTSTPEPSATPQETSMGKQMQQETLNTATPAFDWRNLAIAVLAAALALSTFATLLLRRKTLPQKTAKV